MANFNYQPQRPQTGGASSGGAMYQGGQDPGYGRGRPGVKSTGKNQQVVSTTPVGGSGTQGGNGTAASPYYNPGGNVGQPKATAPPQNYNGSGSGTQYGGNGGMQYVGGGSNSGAYDVTTMAMGEEGGNGSQSPKPNPGQKAQHPFGGSGQASSQPAKATAKPAAKQAAKPAAKGPVIPKQYGAGSERSYLPSAERLANMGQVERQIAYRSAANQQRADNIGDAQQRVKIRREYEAQQKRAAQQAAQQAAQKAAQQKAAKAPPANVAPFAPPLQTRPENQLQPHPFLPPGTNIHPPQRPPMQEHPFLPPGTNIHPPQPPQPGMNITPPPPPFLPPGTNIHPPQNPYFPPGTTILPPQQPQPEMNIFPPQQGQPGMNITPQQFPPSMFPPGTNILPQQQGGQNSFYQSVMQALNGGT